jgi:N,N-dimethylformamidase
MSFELTGYADQLSLAPGERLRFMVSTEAARYEVTIVRVIQADENPRGPGYTEEVIPATVNGSYPGRRQIVYPGSYTAVPHHPALNLTGSLTLQAWIYPTTPQNPNAQGLVTKWSKATEAGYGLCIGEAGDVEFWLGAGDGHVARIGSGKTLRARHWYFVAAVYDAARQHVRLYQLPLSPVARETSAAVIEQSVQIYSLDQTEAPVLIGAVYGEAHGLNRMIGRGLYNGKLDSPRVFSRALDPAEIEQLRQDIPPGQVAADALTAAWDFANNFSSSKVIDTGPHQLNGVAVNMPARAMTGHNWSGAEFDFRHAPAEYGALYFHEDDLEDARWETDFEWQLPSTLRSGFYAARLTADGHEDHIPFIVRPPRNAAQAPIAFLAPTFTYLAYANDRMETLPRHRAGITDRAIAPGPLDIFLADHPEFVRSLYDHHRDGMRCLYSSRLRPIVSLRPKYRYWLVNAPRHLSGDLYFIAWLEHHQLPYDVITDEDLHAEGQALLARYQVVVTGSHPEYWTTPMMTALEGYLNAGGRMMYLGGNGMYWVTGVDPERPHIIEVRRSVSGIQPLEGAPGEGHLSTTGEAGALWRGRGKAPNQVVGIGFTAQGWGGRAPGYRRQPGSFDPRAAFIFEGIGPDEVIGDFGLVLGGAAGDELDRTDYELGTPPHTLVLASSSGHSQAVTPVLEDIPEISASVFMEGNPNVRADMVYFETPNNGAVFSVGSICWFSSLPHNRYDNNVSRITHNVIRQFMEVKL